MTKTLYIDTKVQYAEIYEAMTRVWYVISAPNLPSDWVVYKHFHDSAPTEPTHSGGGISPWRHNMAELWGTRHTYGTRISFG